MLAFLSPIAAIPVFPKSGALRTCNFAIQCLLLILMIVSFLVWVVAIEIFKEKLSTKVCGLRNDLLWKDKDALYEDLDQCTKEAHGIMILATAIAFVTAVPLQVFAVTFFRAFRDNIIIIDKGENTVGKQ